LPTANRGENITPSISNKAKLVLLNLHHFGEPYFEALISQLMVHRQWLGLAMCESEKPPEWEITREYLDAHFELLEKYLMEVRNLE